MFFLGKKLFRIFLMIYNFAIAITRIHFAICEVRSDNLNPGIIKNYYLLDQCYCWLFFFFVTFYLLSIN